MYICMMGYVLYFHVCCSEELQSVRQAQEALLKRAGKCKVLIVLSADATYSPRNERELVKVAKQVFAK